MGKVALIKGVIGQAGSCQAELVLEEGCDAYGLIRRSSQLERERMRSGAEPRGKTALKRALPLIGVLLACAPSPRGRAEQADGFAELETQIRQCPRWNNERLAREALRPEALILPGDRTPVDVALRRTRALLEHLQNMAGGPELREEAAGLAELERRNADGPDTAALHVLFREAATLRRKIAFSNPLLDFDKIVFLKRNRARYEHMCDQYYGFHAVPGGGVHVLENPFGDKPVVRDVLSGSVVETGRLKGKSLDGGTFISLELDYEAERILFAWAAPEASKLGGRWTTESTYHIFAAGIDGKGLAQLTDGPWNDFDPCVLPNGRIAFVSERCGGFLRCGRHCPVYTLHGMMPDGSDVIALSFHETHEWHPSVDNNGMIVYTRWDYVDRDSDVAHHIWHCYPDGRDARSYHGNYPTARERRPWMEMSIRAVPGSHKYIAVATPHHGQAYGTLVMIDLSEEDDRAMSQLKRMTPEAHIPESESAPGVPHGKGRHSPRGEIYGTPWPLSEDFCLCVYDPGQKNYGIYLVDSFGNRELLYRDPRIACLDPIPLRPRGRPPAIALQTDQAAADRLEGLPPTAMGTVRVMNVYESDYPWPPETKISELRLINLFPKATPPPDKPRIGHADQSLARGVLGTVPVEQDGSAHFRVPAGVPFYMQALDDKGLCVQNMRSDTYVHPGSTLSCIGCHEPKNGSMTNRAMPLAMRRAPSIPRKEAEGSYPLTFPRLVQPVLDRNCVACHQAEKNAPSLSGDRFGAHGWSEAMLTLNGHAWGRHGGNGAIKTRNEGRSFSIPGKEGARVSKLYNMLRKGHHDVKLAPDDLRRIALWLDCNSCFYGAYFETDKQARGEVVKPRLGTPPWLPFEELVQ